MITSLRQPEFRVQRFQTMVIDPNNTSADGTTETAISEDSQAWPMDPPTPPTQVSPCRKCGVDFNRALPTCPDCGATRVRRKRRDRKLLERWQKVTGFVEQKKYYFIYVGIGGLASGLMRPVVMFLAEFSKPEGWRAARELGKHPFSAWHVIEPFVAALQTIGRWIVQGTFGFAIWAYETVIALIVSHPSGTTLGIIGAAVGFWMARRRDTRRGSRAPRRR